MQLSKAGTVYIHITIIRKDNHKKRRSYPPDYMYFSHNENIYPLSYKVEGIYFYFEKST